MKPKIVPFKFTKKQIEPKGKSKISKKNYENIFNDILSGKKQAKNPKPTVKKENLEQNYSNIAKKNKIKFIAKLEKIDLSCELNDNAKNTNLSKFQEQTSLREDNNCYTHFEMNNKAINFCTTENKENIENKNIIDDYLMKNSIVKNKKKATIEIKEKFNTVNNRAKEKELISFLDKKEKSYTQYNNNKNKHNFIKCVKTMNDNSLAYKNKKKESSNSVLKNDYSYKRNFSNINRFKTKSFKQNNNNKENKLMEKVNKMNKLEKNRKQSFPKTNNTQNYIRKNKDYKVVRKITITNDNNKEVKYKDYISIKNTIQKKRLILNNTNSNINININITNINDKNHKKESVPSSKRKKSDNNEDNYNSNITTVNIINNNNISKNLKSNDYQLLFNNNSKRKFQPFQTKISSKGIKIESIDINLNEEEQSSSKKKRKFKFKKNIKKNKNYQNNILEQKEKLEAQSEYGHILDLDDFWSNKSSTSFSCKSGFTASRKIRSLSRERDKFKMLNNLKNWENNKIAKIEDKLKNIVNKFHNDSNNNTINERRKAIKIG